MLIFSPCSWHKIFSYRYFTDISGVFVVYSGASGKESACQFRRLKRLRFDPWVGKILWRRKRQPTPVFLPAVSHGQRSLVGHSPRGHKESDTASRLRIHIHIPCTSSIFLPVNSHFLSAFCIHC